MLHFNFFVNMALKVREIANSNGFDIHDEKFARFLDEKDELKSCRSEFHYPKNKTLPPGKRCLIKISVNYD